MLAPEQRRKLTEEDLRRMRLPERFWRATWDQCSRETKEDVRNGKKSVTPSLHNVVESSIRNLDAMYRSGVGIMLWGDNGRGKTSALAVIGKEFRRRGCTVLFTTAEGLRSSVLQKVNFDLEQTMWERAISVDVLILDDLGKEHRDQQGFGERLFEDLIRQRTAAKRVTLITTNMSPAQMQDPVTGYKVSMLKVMKESVTPIMAVGATDFRDESARNNVQLMTGTG